MDDLLRATLRSRAADPTAACVDAETVAAFIDGTLSARARAGAEAHIADCARCQAVLAALVKSTPPPRDRVWWRRPAIAWLIPAAATAAAVAVWINVPDSASGRRAPIVRDDAAVPLASAPIRPVDAGPPTPEAQPQTPSATDRAEADKMARARESARAAAKILSTRSLSDTLAGGETRQAKAIAPAPTSAPPSPVGAAAAVAPSGAAASADAARADAANSTASHAEAVTVSGAAPIVDTFTVAGTAPVTERVRVATFATASPPIISSNRVSQWRVGTTGEVQHTADGGKTWQSQATGVNATPVAGSSPSPSVCWLVGRGGLVLITTDGGQSWRRLPFTLAIDLASVSATDDQTATIVSVDGRTFTTSDAGRSWK
jgi:hypothetical protein